MSNKRSAVPTLQGLPDIKWDDTSRPLTQEEYDLGCAVLGEILHGDTGDAN